MVMASIRKDIQKILETAIHAPSGDNSQPWEFYVTEGRITLANVPDRDNPILNYQQRGSYVAHGGVIENIVIAGSHLGYKSSVTLFPRNNISHAVAEISLEKQGNITDNEGLYKYILERRTNRKPYSMQPLLDKEMAELIHIPRQDLKNDQRYKIYFFDHPRTRHIMAEAGASIEKIILENEELHYLLFKDVIWSKSVERQRRHGLFIDTMEFAAPQRIAFWLASHWPLMKIFAWLGLPNKIVRDDTRLYATGSAMCIITAEKNEPHDYVEAGRILQHIWLVATKMGISIQPVTALLFAAERVIHGDTWTLKEGQITGIKKYYELLTACTNIGAEHLMIMFRIGFADTASATSSRREPVIHFS